MLKSTIDRLRKSGALNKPSRRGIIVTIFAVCVLIPSVASTQNPVINSKISIDQRKLEAGQYPVGCVLESGGQFFSVPYLPFNQSTNSGDGYGEGPDGPRTAQRNAFYPADYPNYRFLRVNGLDSQSCYECHNSIGTYVVDPSNGAMLRKPYSFGGGAGSNSNAFINPYFANRLTYLIRNPPHVFGSGYTNMIGFEIMQTLWFQRQAARIAAKNQPGAVKEIKLEAKGVSYGTFRTSFKQGGQTKVVGCADFSSDPNKYFGMSGFPMDGPYKYEPGYMDDYSEVTGVACDLIVRPFQWKGISSSVRHFARDALDFHLSMQAEEKYGHLDCDKDGKRDEMTLGNVSALVAFATMTRPPRQVIPPGMEAKVRLGEQIFKGERPGLPAKMCASCHVPDLRLNRAVLHIDNPGVAKVTQKDCDSIESGLVSALPADELEAVRTFNALSAQAHKHPTAMALAQARPTSPDEIYNTLRQAVEAVNTANLTPGYNINLTNPGEVPGYVLPRLAANSNGTVSVPLFSDLRLHNMGQGLQDVGPQGADVTGVSIPAPLFLTRPLWGVADTNPYLHDGRALTLLDAILLHESPGSEANNVIAAFKKLSREEKDAVAEFLLSLRLLPPKDVELRQNCGAID